MDEADLTDFLRDWPYESGQINVRRVEGRDGRSKVQVRIDLGVLQLELEGRPDGRRPYDFESLLDYQKDRQHRYERESGRGEAFALSPDECRALREEAVQYYHRYVALFALGDYPGVIRDTTRNLDMFDLCRQFAATEFDRVAADQFRPSVILMRTRAAAEMWVAQHEPNEALAAIDAGLDDLRAAFEAAGRVETFEDANEVQFLRRMRDALVPKLPSSQRVELEERLRAAIDAENYELAAILRDELRMLRG